MHGTMSTLKIGISVLLVMISRQANAVSDNCRADGQTLTCWYTIPVSVPQYATQVVVRNLIYPIIAEDTFAHVSWWSVRKLDLSSNNIACITRNALKGLRFLETIILSNNALFQQSFSIRQHHCEAMLTPLANLQNVDLSLNNAKHVPRNIFVRNYKLKYINLEGNNIEYITLTLNHLRYLERLNLRNNSIAYLKREAIEEIQDLLEHKGTDKNQSFSIDLGDNPLICSCKSLKFLHWLVLVARPLTNDVHTCQLDGELTTINSDTLDQAEYLCFRTVIIASISMATLLFALGTAIGFTIVSSYCMNKIKSTVLRKIRNCTHGRQNRRFINHFKRGAHMDQKYLIFLGASSKDDDVVQNTIYPNLYAEMKALLDWSEDDTKRETDIICSGDTNFRIGRHITHETLRCIPLACTTVFVISKSFCQSHYCCMELTVAMERNKPIVLLFIEHIEEQDMPPFLHTLFKTKSRAKLVISKDGGYELVPGWRDVCESIVSLASTNTGEGTCKKSCCFGYNMTIYCRRDRGESLLHTVDDDNTMVYV